jgi:hypothetical protein
MSDNQTYNLALLSKDEDTTFELATAGNAIVPINLKGLAALNPGHSGQRGPSKVELVRLASIALGQGADPYSNECGLLPVFSGGFHYEPWVAAQVRMRKAQAQPDYRGYKWGWITSDMTRHAPGRESKADPKDIVGAWGEVYRDNHEPFYHEVFMKEYQKSTDKGSWGKTPLTMLAKVIRDQTHKFAYADKMGNLNTFEELQAYNQAPTELPPCSTPKRQDRRTVESTEVTPQEPTPPADTEGSMDTDAGGQFEFEDDIPDTPQEEVAPEPAEDDDTIGSEKAKAMLPALRDAFFDWMGESFEDMQAAGKKPNTMFVGSCAMALGCQEEDVNSSDKFSVNMIRKCMEFIESQKGEAE